MAKGKNKKIPNKWAPSIGNNLNQNKGKNLTPSQRKKNKDRKDKEFLKKRRIQDGQRRADIVKEKKKKDAAFRKKRDSKVRTGKSIRQRLSDNRQRKKRETEEAKVRRRKQQAKDKKKKRQAKADRRAIPKSRRVGGFLLKHAKQSHEKRKKR